ncbi:acylphosphatase [Endozoicomonas sp. Mp262]|uniref:acylphosphatase n=1 Tax=Endozoicomonas sp. Mp262 TaxID=2919499 RepID=UPI0021DADA84
MAKQCRRALVKGCVQGVWFRGATRQQAMTLGITGWAKNLPDGGVEVLMCGEPEPLAELEKWLHQGPRMAKVTAVSVVDVPLQEMFDFTVG